MPCVGEACSEGPQIGGGKSDELDADDFDPIRYINAQFPTEESLGGLDTYLARLDKEIKTLDEKMCTAVWPRRAAPPLLP